MVEGAKIDHGGHSNKLKITIDEHLSFDRVVGIPNKVFELLN